MSLFTSTFKSDPYWWEDAAPTRHDTNELPQEVDVAIVGSGYTGLNAAIVLARAGRNVIILEAEETAWGCSSRNGGQISPGVKPGVDTLERRYGREAAHAILHEGHASLEFLGDFVKAEEIDCDYQHCGRFIGVHRPGRYDALAAHFKESTSVVPFEWHMVPPAETASELGTEAYHGGAVMPAHASLHPARYAAGLASRATQAGVDIATSTHVDGIASDNNRVTVRTSRGTIQARDVIVATNGYTGAATPGLRRRVIPIGSYVIATEPLEPAVMQRIMPKKRVISDTRKVVYYYRPSPDHTRVVFGGRVALGETDPKVSAPRLHKVMTDLFPELKQTRISHSWMGFVAYTFDEIPHIGTHDGVWFATGYCGSGVAWASYLGHRLGHKVLGNAEGKTAFDDMAFPTRPLYNGRPWFLGFALAWHKTMDRWGP